MSDRLRELLPIRFQPDIDVLIRDEEGRYAYGYLHSDGQGIQAQMYGLRYGRDDMACLLSFDGSERQTQLQSDAKIYGSDHRTVHGALSAIFSFFSAPEKPPEKALWYRDHLCALDDVDALPPGEPLVCLIYRQ